MIHPLKPFSAAATPVQLGIQAERRSRQISFQFILQEPKSKSTSRHLFIPDIRPVETRVRRDELWKSTCLEIFASPAGQEAYVEMNLAPSGDWNVYAFESYRQGMRPVEEALAPLISVNVRPDGSHVFQGVLQFREGSAYESFLFAGSLVMGATAVLEYQNKNGSSDREYWALAHAGPQPDFHLRESLILSL